MSSCKGVFIKVIGMQRGLKGLLRVERRAQSVFIRFIKNGTCARRYQGYSGVKGWHACSTENEECLYQGYYE
jgi:hypothetical protein